MYGNYGLITSVLPFFVLGCCDSETYLRQSGVIYGKIVAMEWKVLADREDLGEPYV